MSFTLIPSGVPSKLWVPMDTGYQREKFLGTVRYRVPVEQKIPGISQKKFFGYRVSARKFLGYRWVLGTGKVFNDADPCSTLVMKGLTTFRSVGFVRNLFLFQFCNQSFSGKKFFLIRSFLLVFFRNIFAVEKKINDENKNLS